MLQPGYNHGVLPPPPGQPQVRAFSVAQRQGLEYCAGSRRFEQMDEVLGSLHCPERFTMLIRGVTNWRAVAEAVAAWRRPCRRRVAYWQSAAFTRQRWGFDSFRAYQSLPSLDIYRGLM